MSTALIMCGNSPNALTSAMPAIYCGNSGPGALSGGTMAGFSAALIDYHIFGGKEPPRGRLFDQHEMHIQGGRFDVPFGLDYQYFANKDRVNISMPLTTTRLQLGGYNADGVRTYGGFGPIHYTAYWTDAIYPVPANDGDAVGGRLGFDLDGLHDGLHDENTDSAEIGFSHITEFDKRQNARNSVYGTDLSLKYDIFRWESEYMYVQSHQADETSFVGVGSLNDLSSYNSLFQSRHQQGYQSTLVANLEQFVKLPILGFARFSRWEPSQKMRTDEGGNSYKINGLSMLTFGFNYKMGEHLTFKLEYNDSLNTSVKERYFDKRLGMGQVIVSF